MPGRMLRRRSGPSRFHMLQPGPDVRGEDDEGFFCADCIMVRRSVLAVRARPRGRPTGRRPAARRSPAARSRHGLAPSCGRWALDPRANPRNHVPCVYDVKRTQSVPTTVLP